MRSAPALIGVALMTTMGCSGPTAPSAAAPRAVQVPERAPDPGPFTLVSAAIVDGGTLPAEYTCDGSGSTVDLSWSSPPASTREFAVLMSTLPGDGTTKWNWVLYGIPVQARGLVRNSSGVGTLGVGSDGPQAAYQPPCSQGPGPKVYTFTVYALSGQPPLPPRPSGAQVLSAMAPLVLGSASLTVTYTRGR